jgi:hypothetical protein
MADKDTDTLTLIPSGLEVMRDVMADLGHHDEIKRPAHFDFEDAHMITLPNHRKVEDLTEAHRKALEYLKPARRKGTARLTNLQSLIAWANRFKGDTSALFANPDMTAPTLTCIADYHAEGAIDVDSPAGDETARHCHHRAVYNFPLSDEWKAWMAISGKPLDKDDMGEFIEAQASTILDPTPAVIDMTAGEGNADWENRLIETALRIEGRYGQLRELLAMSRQFQVHEKSDLAVTTNRDTGETEVRFTSEHRAPGGSRLNIPNLIIVAIPVFMGGAPYRMAVRFRYRKMGGEVKFILSIYNPERVFEDAFDEATQQAESETALPLFMGTPEA